MSDNSFHVLVAGGGIGGLCLAQALRQAGISVAVYERDAAPDSRLDRYRLHINPAGSRSLHACLPQPAWQSFLATAGRSGGGFGFLTERLDTMVVVEDDLMYPPATDPAEQWYPVDRATLRDVLLTGLSGIVSFGKALEHYETGPGGRVIACFSDGSQATGDVLVGADGTRSRVRQQLLPQAGPSGTGVAGIGLKLSLTPATRAWLPPRLATGENLILAPSPFFLFTSVFDNTHPDGHVSQPPSGDASGDSSYLLCAFVLRQGAHPADLAGRSPAQLQETVLDLTRRWHPDLRRALAKCDPGSVGYYPFQATDPIPAWPGGNVALLGDAIHTMPPTGGLGANTALRDARLLGQHLTAVATGQYRLPQAISAYEAQMRPYASAAVRASLTTLRQGLLTNPALLAGMRTWLRLSGALPAMRRAGFRTNWSRHTQVQPWEAQMTGVRSAPIVQPYAN
jgi:2-polyprenyl-6-methoxyphenol hydroxylase-like FAD-dependent oxidoreductase